MLEIFGGEIYVIIGENGVGKLMLMWLFFGYIVFMVGILSIDGQFVCFDLQNEVQEVGIVLVYQEILLVDGLMVVDNFFFGWELMCYGVVDDCCMCCIVLEKLVELGCYVLLMVLV